MEAIDVLNELRHECNKRQHDTYSTGETNIAAMCGESADALERIMCELTRETERANAAENEIARLRAELALLQKRYTAPIVCMCGSTRFKQTWIAENSRLTQDGNIVLSVGLWGHHERKFPEPDVKAILDALHKRKIDLCDWVWVLDVGGYIGASTKSEIEYATATGKPIRYLSKEIPEYVEPLDEVAEENKQLRAELTKEREIKEAAIIDIHEMLKGNTGDCAYCKFKDAECSEKFCIEKAEWRGKEASPDKEKKTARLQTF